MIKVIIYQVSILLLAIISWLQKPLGNYPNWLKPYELPLDCVIVALVGGVMYCLRAIYLERCLKNNWSAHWEAWYYLRPLTSAISGFVAYIFLKAGLIILEGDQVSNSGNFGFLALCFIAGYNVSNFSQKIEDIAKSTFGIEKSRSSQNKE